MGLSRLARPFAVGTAIATVFGAAAHATEIKTYTYDALGRLVSQVSDGTVNNDDARTYCYDSNGNRTRVVANQSGATASCSPNPTPTPSAKLSISNATVTEGGTLSFTVTRSGNTSIAASASYATANGSAVAPGDYTSKSGTVSFSAGQTSKTITIATVNDSATESTETMSVGLSNPSANTEFVDDTAVGTINDNDVAAARLAISNASASEGGTLSFAVTRSGNTAIAASASYATANGSAIAPGDYTAKSGTVSFSAGQTSRTITVATVSDGTVESNETMSVTLSNPSANTTFADNAGVGTINNLAANDLVPIYRFYLYPKYFLTRSYSEGAASGYSYQSIGFNLFRINASGRRPLYRCFSPASGGHFVSKVANCEGQNQEGTLGYAATSQLTGLVPLYRFYNVNTASHLITVNYSEGTSGGFSYESTLGYVAP